MNGYLSVLIFLSIVTSLLHIVTSLKCYEGLKWAESEDKPRIKECEGTHDVCLFGNATLLTFDYMTNANVPCK